MVSKRDRIDRIEIIQLCFMLFAQPAFELGVVLRTFKITLCYRDVHLIISGQRAMKRRKRCLMRCFITRPSRHGQEARTCANSASFQFVQRA